MKVALVHDWLVGQRGGEQVLLALCKMFPKADIFTLVHAKGSVHPRIEEHRIITSFIASLPQSPKHFRPYLGLFPRAIEAFDLRAYDLVISSSHCVAHGVLHAKAHIAYVHTPMRYIWDQLRQYLPSRFLRPVLYPLALAATRPLRRWDRRAALRPHVMVANSHYVAHRIARCWDREAEVVYPPVDVEYFSRPQAHERRGYLVVSALVPYKRVDVAVRAASAFEFPLTVVGDGGESLCLRRMAGPNVRFIERLSRPQLRELYASSLALIHCGVEDFGIVPVEAMAAGCPVIALGEGGLCETVRAQGPSQSGVFFVKATPDDLWAAIKVFESMLSRGVFDATAIAQSVRRFDSQHFQQSMQSIVGRIKQSWRSSEERRGDNRHPVTGRLLW